MLKNFGIEIFKKSYDPTYIRSIIGYLWRPAISYMHLKDYNKAMNALNFYSKAVQGTVTETHCPSYVAMKILTIKGNIYRKMKKYKEAMEC